ncbi:hypothetical protein SARC_08139 [Sphaeroforma arctica JP610]|uniref:CUB domain-containing protein n=1 Tax=Sphaeroforma arctica JP610 TaxID=667725 RepID=A0A0L0FU67_9EUKA|nr:hypothetical protein SARC_08139 [Sphaeroforma arctica JP610]KNC79473.1 hypothetical protein SARC_08139 [Sphaeroforma arctica JP610]|eukprot:XP_014153375.1 hypothetical protein SARC_08139 [Sphaeroforma arctica JP610]
MFKTATVTTLLLISSYLAGVDAQAPPQDGGGAPQNNNNGNNTNDQRCPLQDFDYSSDEFVCNMTINLYDITTEAFNTVQQTYVYAMTPSEDNEFAFSLVYNDEQAVCIFSQVPSQSYEAVCADVKDASSLSLVFEQECSPTTMYVTGSGPGSGAFGFPVALSASCTRSVNAG